MISSAAEHEYQAPAITGVGLSTKSRNELAKMAADLTRAEIKLVEAAATGAIADYRSSEGIETDPANGAQWDDERTISASVIYALSVGTNPDWPVLSAGLRIVGARIKDELNFTGVEIRFPLAFVDCYIEQPIILSRATIHSIVLTGSRVRGIEASSLRTQGDVLLDNNFIAEGAVSLTGAHIGGDLVCSGGIFENSTGDALSADGIDVGGNLRLGDGFHAKGAVRLRRARIKGDLSCSGGTFENPGGDALTADEANIDGHVLLSNGFKSIGEVSLRRAKLDGLL